MDQHPHEVRVSQVLQKVVHRVVHMIIHIIIVPVAIKDTVLTQPLVYVNVISSSNLSDSQHWSALGISKTGQEEDGRYTIGCL